MPFLTDMYHEQNAVRECTDEDVMTAGPAGFDQQAFLDRLGGRILGQPDALEAVARTVAIARAGVTDPGRPLASVLLVGPTGVGKTELVRRIAAELRSGPDDLCRIDMAALAQEHYAASFSGAPPGYAGSKESFTLFDKNKIEGDPFMPGIVLLDEIEKADPTVIRALLHVLDSGWLRLANGRETISFRNSYVFITSNLGSRDAAEELRHERRWYRRARRMHTGRSRKTVIDAVESFFDPEFFNRIDETVVMDAFQPATARQVTALEVDIVVGRLARESVELRVDPAVLDLLQDGGFDPVYGARGLRRTIRRHLIAPVAECVLASRPSGRSPIVLRASVSADSVVVTAGRPS
ncbi:AAA family ATPase [Mycolicibacterium frederiksbergense]|uniref:ATP-dependent Clp protease ATP-binding subunit n=1 Tax=Mycolicibacterium frederiksbergense TaxID=117567 RepID=A0A6H0S5A4_9MYCO|nr:AAA family ATPase [Mycolicibacterium frederiksbergense]QIV81619.1 ATP-dependent Clp protease ATP-binding subunit [Mycolicibacterium frederiksbergense]